MIKTFSSACLLASLFLASAVQAAPAGDATIKTLLTVQVRPDVAWVGSEHNERIVTLATVTVRPDAITRLQAGAMDAVALLPQIEAVPMPSLSLELPRFMDLSHSVRASIGGL